MKSMQEDQIVNMKVRSGLAEKKRTCGSKIGSTLQKFDLLGETFTMNIDAEGKKRQTTILGASLSIFLYMIVLIYSVQQSTLMFKKEKIDMITSTDEYFFAETEVFNAD